MAIKNKANSNRQRDFSCELEHSLHYQVLIAANKDPGIIDLLPVEGGGKKKKRGDGAMNP